MTRTMTRTRTMSIAALLVLWSVVETVEASCRSTSDVGGAECLSLTSYNNVYQWATCLTNSYIKTISKQKHECRDTSATYCYYQCQLELHNEESGPVSNDCRCSQGSTLPKLTLDADCDSPSGEDCNWYGDCLEKRIPCAGGNDGYAIEYAQTFCKKFTDAIPKLSAEGQKWVSATRMCLQVVLAPLLRSFAYSPNCASVKDIAFKSHPGCYLNPPLGAPSMCDLPCKDWLTVFWTIKSAFISVPVETLAGMFEVAMQCASWRRLGLCLKDSAEYVGTTLLKIFMQLPLELVVSSNFRVRRAAQNDSIAMSAQELHYSKLSLQLANGIAKDLGWAERGLIWFAFGEATHNNTVIAVNVVLADRQSYGLSQTSGQLTPNLTMVIEEAAAVFQSGGLNDVKVDNYYVQLLTLSTCEDGDCQQAELKSTAPPNANFGPNSGVLFQASMALAIVSCLFVFLLR